MLLLYRQESILAVSRLPQTQKGEVRGQSSLAVSADTMEAGKEQPARGVQNPPPHGVGRKWFPDILWPPGVMV
jgi:hypothetical protein